MDPIRPFVESDIPQVAELHRLVFQTADRSDPRWRDTSRAYFWRVFLENPSRDPALPSLVYDADDGRVAGFVGVVPRRIRANGRRFTAAISSQFVVAPGPSAGLVALRLASAFLNGPQDLSISDEANDTSRRIWEGLGGTTAIWHSLYWTRALKPARYAVSVLGARAGLAPLARAASPVAPLVDALAARMPYARIQRPPAGADPPEELSGRTMLAWTANWMRATSLHVEYDEPTLEWLLARARQRRHAGTLRATVVRRGPRIIGWYLYHLDEGRSPSRVARSRTATVLQIASEPACSGEVVDRLFTQASADGAMAVSGRVDSRTLQALTDRYCLLHRRGPWVLVKAKHPDLLRPFETGDACFSRFDGEWCLGF
jgi:hypothetical protein